MSGGTTSVTAGVRSGSAFTACAGGVHGTLGKGGAPATPLTRGVPQPAIVSATPAKVAWRSLFVCDIIPNTRFTAVLLVNEEGFVRRVVALHLAFRTRSSGADAEV